MVNHRLIHVIGLALACSLFSGRVDAQALWFDRLPESVRQSILWQDDFESGSLDHWTNKSSTVQGGGVFNTGGKDAAAVITEKVSHSGRYSVGAVIRDAYRCQNGKRAVRLMRWTDQMADIEGDFFPKKCFFSTWVFVPVAYNAKKYGDWDPGDGGWWNIFQFKANDAQDQSCSVFNLDLFLDEETRTAQIGGYHHLQSRYYQQKRPISVPIRRWFHLEVFLEVAFEDNGQIQVWQDGNLILDIQDIPTIITTKNSWVTWGVGNYTDHIEGGKTPGSATVYFDDAAVSRRRISEFMMEAKQLEDVER